ncbi:MAG TPA: leucyl/phenylalanyl-tRNA--protein transferase [Phycisphaerae bacterium]|nr:leucyl/phenylalanyl-tRNA--protein transferase [Phycisphaerae bacterium]
MQTMLAPHLLLEAYRLGIFPMADEDGQIRWFSPDPRAIIELDRFHVPRTLRQVYRQHRFDVRVDTAFERVIRACADRPEPTWISPEIIQAYTRLHRLGHAHSVESWQGGCLVGGLYGVALGGAFFGESMFHRVTDASKVGLVVLVERLTQRGFCLLDVQFHTPHLARFGVQEIPRAEYLRRLQRAVLKTCRFVD